MTDRDRLVRVYSALVLLAVTASCFPGVSKRRISAGNQ